MQNRFLPDQKADDPEYLILFVQIIVTWAHQDTYHDPWDHIFLVRAAISFIAYLYHRYLYSGDYHGHLNDIMPDYITKLLKSFQPHDHYAYQQCLQDNGMVGIAIQMIWCTQMFTKKLPQTMVWMDFLHVLASDNPRCQEEAIKHNVMQMSKEISCVHTGKDKFCHQSAVTLFVLFIAESFDKIPKITRIGSMLSTLRFMLNHNGAVPLSLACQTVKLCNVIRKKDNLVTHEFGRGIVISLLQVILKKKPSNIVKWTQIIP